MKLLSEEVAESFHVAVVPGPCFVLECHLEAFSGACTGRCFCRRQSLVDEILI